MFAFLFGIVVGVVAARYRDVKQFVELYFQKE